MEISSDAGFTEMLYVDTHTLTCSASAQSAETHNFPTQTDFKCSILILHKSEKKDF